MGQQECKKGKVMKWLDALRAAAQRHPRLAAALLAALAAAGLLSQDVAQFLRDALRLASFVL